MKNMKNIPLDEIYSKIFKKLTSTRWQQKWNIEKIIIDDYLKDSSFSNNLSLMITNDNYSCNSTLLLCKDLMDKLAYPSAPFDWLNYIYQYTLSKAFPEAVSIILLDSLSPSCELYLRVLHIICEAEKISGSKNWASKYPINFLTLNEENLLENVEEYKKFIKAYKLDCIYEMMKISSEITNDETFNHVCYVYHMALDIARQLKKLKVPVDCGKVSCAAASYFIGKFYCKVEELRKSPYINLYYTDQWFKKYSINYIRNIAVNHSFMRLEIENMPIEALILMYADSRFRIDEALIIKNENQDTKVILDYKKTCAQLDDFENYIINIGVKINTDGIHEKSNFNKNRTEEFALVQGNDIVDNFKFTFIDYNIHIMNKLRDEYSLETILDSARNENQWKNLMEYISVLHEYSSYLSQNQKLQTLNFLFENLNHPEDDIRRSCADLIGKIIAIYDDVYINELSSFNKNQLNNNSSIGLLKKYFLLMLSPGSNYIPAHKSNIGFCISIMVESLFKNSGENMVCTYRDEILKLYTIEEYKHNDKELFLLQASRFIPLNPYSDNLNILYDYVLALLDNEASDLKLEAIDVILHLLDKLSPDLTYQNKIKAWISTHHFDENETIENLLIYKISCSLNLNIFPEKFKNSCELVQKDTTEIFLSNLKTDTAWIKKENQIQLLLDYALKNVQVSGLHSAIHFCNLLNVSENQNVRDKAGDGILTILPYLSFAERNEIAIELLRALEIEGNKFTEYIPKYTGQVLLYLHPKELDEIIDDLSYKVKTSNSNLKSLIIKTIGVTIINYAFYKNTFNEDSEKLKRRLIKMLGIILTGLGDYHAFVKQSSFSVITKGIFCSPILTLEEKKIIFTLIAKKILTLLTYNMEDVLLSLINATGLKFIYRFISDYTVNVSALTIPISPKVVFFPGTFDPFSQSQKEIALLLQDMNYEIYLSVDEFSWSKKTLPSLLRKNILSISISDSLNLFVFPGCIPINISNNENLLTLKKCFPNSKVYLAAGNDTLLNNSYYSLAKNDYMLFNFPHILFESKESEKFKDVLLKIKGEVIFLNMLSKDVEISLTQIRSYIDENKDISSLVDPVAMQYIYENGFYQREAQEKSILKSIPIEINIYEELNRNLLNEIGSCIPFKKSVLIQKLKELSQISILRLLLVRNSSTKEIIAFSIFHWIRSSMFFEEFGNSTLTDYVRENSLGRIMVIDGFFVLNSEKNKNTEQILLTETLAFCSSHDYEFVIFKSIISELASNSTCELLKLHGFYNLLLDGTENDIYAVNMSTPCVLNLDIENIIKEPFRSSMKVFQTFMECRKKLQLALTKLYPGQLILSFDTNYLHQVMIRKICEENGVSTEINSQNISGSAMCVPYGDFLDKYIIPNTVTETLHTEKIFYPDMKSFQIGEFPHYLKLGNQVKVIKSFNRPVILVDNLIHKGYRLKALDPFLKCENVGVNKTIAGIMSGRGKDIMDRQKREVDSVYFIPRLKLWFNENAMYPFIGGDAIWRGTYAERNLLPSINLILPYTSPSFIKNTSRRAIYNLSKVCIENSLNILSVIEEEYHNEHKRNLNLESLGQVFTIPRCPDHGSSIKYDLSKSASHYLKNDLELLERLESLINS